VKRWHEDYPRTRREWKKHHLSHVESNLYRGEVGRDPYEIDCVCDVQKGRFRKRRAFGTPRSRSSWYRPEKYPRLTGV